jgi:hypothetical protein
MKATSGTVLVAIVVALMCAPVLVVAQEREPRPRDPKADTGTRPPREKGPFVPYDYEAPIRQPRIGDSYDDHYSLSDYNPWTEPVVLHSSANPLMDVYQLTIASAIATNASTLASDGGIPAFGAAGIVMGMISLAVAPTRHTSAQRAGFIVAGVASIVLGAFNLDDGGAAVTVPFSRTASTTLFSVSF